MNDLTRRSMLGSLAAAPWFLAGGPADGKAPAHGALARNEAELDQALKTMPIEGGTVWIDGDIEITKPVRLQAAQRLIGFGSGIPVANQHPHPSLDRTRKVPSGLHPSSSAKLEWIVEIAGPAEGKQIWAVELADLSIENPAGGGVRIENSKNIRIQRCGISRCGTGILLRGERCYNVDLFQNLMESNREHAVWIAQSKTEKGADKVHVVGGDYQSHNGPSVFRIDGGQGHVFRDFQTGVSLPQAKRGEKFKVFEISGDAHGILIDSIYSENILEPIVSIAPEANVGSLVIQNLVVHGVLPECPAVLSLGNAEHIHITGGYVKKWDEKTPTILNGKGVDLRGLPSLKGNW